MILREIEVRYKFCKTNNFITGQKLESPDLVYDIFSFLKYESKERFIVINLNNQHAVMNYETVASGTVNSVQLRPCEVLRTAIILNSPAVILLHNHPSGVPEPSNSDIAFTKKVVKAGKLLGIEILDHVIVGENDFVSLKKRGAL